MNWKQIVGDYFTFSRKERIAVIVLITLIMLLLFIPRFFDGGSQYRGYADSSWLNSGDTISREQGFQPGDVHSTPLAERSYRSSKKELFAFDPNQLDEAGWRRLGLRETTVRIILNFRSKGGRFRKADDLRKIYGLFPDEFERIKPFAQFEEKENASADELPLRKKPAREYLPREKSYPVIELNSADTTALISLPGIGAKLAKRIIAFRDKLGGFHSNEQLREVYGLRDSVLQSLTGRLSINIATVKRININKADINMLRSHPYLQMAAIAIISYRNAHGLFADIESLKKVMVMTSAQFEKCKPYLTTRED